MHARHFIAWGFVFGLVPLLVSACAATVDGAEPEQEISAETQQSIVEDPIDVTARFMCKGLDVVECMIECGKAGTPCTPQIKHPKDASLGRGDLYACRTSYPRSCDYRYSNGDRCYFMQKPDYFLCRHNHG